MISEEIIRSRVERLFSEITFSDEPKGLYDPLRYMISIGGKRIRPTLCLTTYGLYNDDFTDEVLAAAEALEVFHTFTLIHDDIMDKSPLRRGQETVWTKWDSDHAILSGDAMCIDSYRRLSAVGPDILPEVLHLFSRTAALVCDGQQSDMDFESLDSVPMDQYMVMIARKTAVLLACSAQMGAVIARQSPMVGDTLYYYGYYLGLAFQIADDYLDTYGDECVFGKPIGGDIVNSKKTWLTVKAMEDGAEGLAEAMTLPSVTAQEKARKIARVKEIYESVGVREKALEEIRKLTERALSEAGEVTSAAAYDTLRNFAHALVGRTF